MTRRSVAQAGIMRTLQLCERLLIRTSACECLCWHAEVLETKHKQVSVIMHTLTSMQLLVGCVLVLLQIVAMSLVTMVI